MESQPDDERIDQQPNVGEERRLAQDDRHHCDVHGIAHAPIGAGDHQPLRRGDGGRRSAPLQGESPETLQEQ